MPLGLALWLTLPLQSDLMVGTELGAVLVEEEEVEMVVGLEEGVEGEVGDVMEVCENLCSL